MLSGRGERMRAGGPLHAEFAARVELPVSIAAMSDCADVHDPCPVIDRIDHAIFPDADSPEIVCALKLHTSRRPGLRCQRLDPSDDAPRHFGLEPFELPAGRPRKDNGVLSHAGFAGDGPGRVSLRSPAIPGAQMRAALQARGRRSPPINDLVS